MPITLPDVSTLSCAEKIDLISRIEDCMTGQDRSVWEHALLPDLEGLSVDEKMDLIGHIWDSVKPGEITMSPELAKELDRRQEELMRDPSRAVPWEEVKARILNHEARS